MSKGIKAMKYNTLSTLLLEIVTLISGLIMPRLILSYFGSASNGLVSSITQFLGFSTILRAGMGGAIRAALYKPIAEANGDAISAIMSATDRHMKKIGTIIGVAIAVFACVYPFFVIDEYSWIYAFSMVLVIGSGTLVENLFGIKCQILIQADQKYYIATLISVVSHLLVTITSAVIILCGGSMHAVKVGAVFAAFIKPILLNAYVKKNYKINWKAVPDEKAIAQRWNAFFQQVATVVNENVSLVILTALQPLASISVYTVHSMVVFNIRAIVNSFSMGSNSAFGSLFAADKKDELRGTFFFIEWTIFAVGCLLYSVTAVMLTPFISLYTASITDVNYHRPVFGVLMVVCAFVASIKLPYQYLVEGAGKFKETRNGAIVEVAVNIIVSAICVIKFGAIGVLMGTVCASVVRTVEISVFCFKNILQYSLKHLLKHALVVVATFTIAFCLGKLVCLFDCTNYFNWVLNAVLVTISSGIVVLIVSLLLYRKEALMMLNNIRRKYSK